MSIHFPTTRHRRLRQTSWVRKLTHETRLSVDDLIWPLIVSDNVKATQPIHSMPGVYRLDLDHVVKEAEKARSLKIPAIALFPHISPNKKTPDGREAYNPNSIIPKAVKAIKSAVPDIGIIVDVALDPYTDHGHDGILKNDKILNDETIDKLVDVSLLLAESGADIIAPSDMMDGRIGAIRKTMENANYHDIIILSYAVKYASAFYSPYRDAIGIETLKGDKKTYQMDPANAEEAIREVELDIQEGADMIMIKPGGFYLDIIRAVKKRFKVPTYAFQVSGEYAMMTCAINHKWVNKQSSILESMQSFKRAGADGILTYFAPIVAKYLQNES